MNLTNEQEFIVSLFKKNFSPAKYNSIIIYGIGRNTEAIISECSGYPITGLMDSTLEGSVCYGKKVFAKEDIPSLTPVPVIVIVARDSVVNIIYKRIENLETYGISILKLDGTCFEKGSIEYKNKDMPYWSLSDADLKKQIDAYDVISFDIFDTLIMRCCLKPSDIFDITEQQCGIRGFAKVRRAAENNLGLLHNIDDYYELIQRELNISTCDIQNIKNIEFETEKSALIARTKMVEMLYYALSKNKTVYLVSDMYYNESQMRELLFHCKIAGNFSIIVSCDKKLSKESGTLFPFIADTSKDRILHIGDNRIADIEMAKAAGLDTFHILSAYEMLEASSMQQILSGENSLENNNLLGFFISRRFNDPFALYNKGGIVTTETLFDIGYYFIAPLIFEYLLYLTDKLRTDGIEKIIFSSRDGYLLYNAYIMMMKKHPDLPEPVYLKISRRCITVAAVQSADDIFHIAARFFSGTAAAFFTQRFGITVNKIDGIKKWQTGSKEAQELLGKYSAEILQNAAKERKSYYIYLQKNKLTENTKKGFFDFVASGTVQYYLERLLNQKLHGYYFATMNLPNNFYQNSDIETAYGNITSYGCNSIFAKRYLLLESILTDPDPTLIKIDESGAFVFSDEARAGYSKIKDIHAGVLQYVEDRLPLLHYTKTEPALTQAARLFGSLWGGECTISVNLKSLFVNDDLYDGRGTYSSFVD
ncbi:MAG: hypothetical protein Ta2B_26510 [Termitinemataceae bacterium]|nr:MAG: hypothetical protein Ta2B_26510 [Termitinemataceae bacterium]